MASPDLKLLFSRWVASWRAQSEWRRVLQATSEEIAAMEAEDLLARHGGSGSVCERRGPWGGRYEVRIEAWPAWRGEAERGSGRDVHASVVVRAVDRPKLQPGRGQITLGGGAGNWIDVGLPVPRRGP